MQSSLETQEYLSGACQWSFFPKGLVLPAEKHTGVILMYVCQEHLLGGRMWGSSIGNQASPVLGSIQGTSRRWLQLDSPKTGRGFRVTGENQAQKKQTLKEGVRDCYWGAGQRSVERLQSAVGNYLVLFRNLKSYLPSLPPLSARALSSVKHWQTHWYMFNSGSWWGALMCTCVYIHILIINCTDLKCA